MLVVITLGTYFFGTRKEYNVVTGEDQRIEVGHAHVGQRWHRQAGGHLSDDRHALLAQAEHGPDSQVILLSDAPPLIDAVLECLVRQVESLPRADIARRSLDHARFVVTDTLDRAFEISNEYAPEHLILALRSPEAFLSRVRAAGSVFLGDHAPETLSLIHISEPTRPYYISYAVFCL